MPHYSITKNIRFGPRSGAGSEAGLPGVAGPAGGPGPEGTHAEPDGDEEPAVKEARAKVKMASAAMKVLEEPTAPATK